MTALTLVVPTSSPSRSVTPWLALDRAERESAHDVALSKQCGDKGHDHRPQCPRADELIVNSAGLLRTDDSYRERPALNRRREGEEKFVPGERQGEHPGHYKSGSDQWQRNAEEHLPSCRTIDLRCLFQLDRDLAEHLGEDDDGKRHVECGVEDDQAPDAIEQARLPHDQEVGRHKNHRRHDTLREKPGRKTAVLRTKEAETRDSIRRKRSQDQGERRGAYCQLGADYRSGFDLRQREHITPGLERRLEMKPGDP